MRCHGVYMATCGALFRPTPETTAGDLATSALSVPEEQAGPLPTYALRFLRFPRLTSWSSASLSAPSRFVRPAVGPGAASTLPQSGNAAEPSWAARPAAAFSRG